MSDSMAVPDRNLDAKAKKDTHIYGDLPRLQNQKDTMRAVANQGSLKIEESIAMQKPTYDELEQRVKELETIVLRNECSKAQNLPPKGPREKVWATAFLKDLDKVSQAMNSAKDVEHIIDDILYAVFTIFGCDRIWLFHPCDPNTATIRVLAEKNKPQYPGAFTTGQEIPISAEAAETIRKALVSGSPVVFGPAAENKIDDVSAQFSVLSQMMMAIHPKTGKPWMFGMHQCSYPRVWTEAEQLLFKEISFRVIEGLENIILLRDLKKSEMKYRRFFTTVRDGWAYQRTITDAGNNPVDYVFLEVNKAFEALTGLKGEDIIGKPATEVFSREHGTGSEWIEKFGRVSLTGKSMTFEGYLEASATWYSVSVSSPERGYSITVFENITKRKNAEKSLRESEQRYTLALQAANVGTWDWDIKTGRLTWSDQIEPMFGFAKGQFSGTYHAFLDCIHPEDRQYVIDSVEEALTHDKDYEIEHRIVWPDKSVHWLSEKGNVFSNSDGEPRRMLGVVLDITEQKESFERLRTILDSLEAMVYVADMHSHELLFVNKFGRKIWGEDICGQTCWQTLQRDQTGPCPFCTNDILLDGEIKPGEPYVWEFQNTIDQEWYECRDQAIQWLDGRLVRMEVATRITQRKEAEEQRRKLEESLRQAQKMEAIGTLAGGIAHDFNNILSVILGYTDLAIDDAPQNSKYGSDLTKVLDAANRAKDLVEQILAFSRQTKIEPVPVHLPSIVSAILKMLRSSIPSTIEIRDRIDTSCGIVLSDPTQVHQIIMNLCTNANHAMEESGGVLEIELKNISLTNNDSRPSIRLPPGDYVELTIADTGCGIGPDVLDKIFDPYFTTKDIGKGTGLGLSIVQGIVADYQGTVTVESQLGRGTSFHVFFPVINREALPLDRSSGTFPPGDERVLFIDDEAILTEMGQEMLERLGYRVTIRNSSLDALTTFQNDPHAFDLVITDQTMPGMTGSDLARRLLQIRPDIPIILCTGYSNLIDETTAKSMGIKAFAMKPLTMSSIAELIRQVLEVN